MGNVLLEYSLGPKPNILGYYIKKGLYQLWEKSDEPCDYLEREYIVYTRTTKFYQLFLIKTLVICPGDHQKYLISSLREFYR